MNAKITKTIVEAVKKYESKFPNITRNELGKLVGISAASVSNISNGLYDYLLEETEEEAKTITSEIPYEDYRRLVRCELAVSQLLGMARASVNEEGLLFVDYRYVSDVLRKCVPEEYQNRLTELEGEKENG